MKIDEDLYFLLLVFRNNLITEVNFNNLYLKNSLSSISSLLQEYVLKNLDNQTTLNLKQNLNIYLDSICKNNLNIISCKSPLFPKDLYKLGLDFRPFLYYKGNIDLLKEKDLNIGVVGTRTPTPTARKICTQIAKDLFKKNYNITSGFARGIDTIAQSCNLKRNILVIPHGFSHCYPLENQQLLNKINKNLNDNLIITPFHFEEGVNVENFRIRNKIIASIIKKLIVVESNVRSGSLMTARYVNLLNKDIYTLLNLNSKGNTVLAQKMQGKDYFSFRW